MDFVIKMNDFRTYRAIRHMHRKSKIVNLYFKSINNYL